MLDLEVFCRAPARYRLRESDLLEYELTPEDPIDDILRGLDNFAQAAEATA